VRTRQYPYVSVADEEKGGRFHFGGWIGGRTARRGETEPSYKTIACKRRVEEYRRPSGTNKSREGSYLSKSTTGNNYGVRLSGKPLTLEQVALLEWWMEDPSLERKGGSTKPNVPLKNSHRCIKRKRDLPTAYQGCFSSGGKEGEGENRVFRQRRRPGTSFVIWGLGRINTCHTGKHGELSWEGEKGSVRECRKILSLAIGSLRKKTALVVDLGRKKGVAGGEGKREPAC